MAPIFANKFQSGQLNPCAKWMPQNINKIVDATSAPPGGISGHQRDVMSHGSKQEDIRYLAPIDLSKNGQWFQNFELQQICQQQQQVLQMRQHNHLQQGDKQIITTHRNEDSSLTKPTHVNCEPNYKPKFDFSKLAESAVEKNEETNKGTTLDNQHTGAFRPVQQTRKTSMFPPGSRMMWSHGSRNFYAQRMSEFQRPVEERGRGRKASR